MKRVLRKLDSNSMLLREMARAGGAVTSVDSELHNLLSYLVEHKLIEHLANVLIGLDEGISERAQIRLDKSFDTTTTTTTTTTTMLIDPRLLQTLEQAEHLCVQDFKEKSNATTSIKTFSAFLSLRWNISMDKHTIYQYEKESKLMNWIVPMLSHAATTNCNETAARYFMAVCKTQRHLKIPLDRCFLTKLIVAMLRRFETYDHEFLYRSFESLYKGLSLDGLRFLFESLQSEMEVDDLRRNLISARCLVRLFRAPSLKGERAKYVSSIAMSSLCRLELTTRRRVEQDIEFQGMLF